MCNEKGGQRFAGSYVFEYGKMDIIADGKDGAIITYGGLVSKALAVRSSLDSQGWDVAVVNMPCVDEADQAVMAKMAALGCIVTYEDHNVKTGVVPVITASLLSHSFKGTLVSFGATSYGASGETDDVLATQGLDVESVTRAIVKKLGDG